MRCSPRSVNVCPAPTAARAATPAATATPRRSPKTNLCVPGADGAAAAIAEIMGVEAEDVVEMVAYVKCNGNCETAKHKYEYAGINNCSAANILFQGEWACPNSCLGYGDCENACPSDAIHVVDNLARIDYDKCVGCVACSENCPVGAPAQA